MRFREFEGGVVGGVFRRGGVVGGVFRRGGVVGGVFRPDFEGGVVDEVP